MDGFYFGGVGGETSNFDETAITRNSQSGDTPNMVVQRNTIMFSCEAFYIGSAIPTETKRGVEGLQQPLRERYSPDVSQNEGYDVKVYVTPDSILVNYESADQENFRLPLATLSVCAAVRCVDTERDSEGNRLVKFMPVHSVLSTIEPDTSHPAIFSCMFRRTEGKHVLDCHAFICKKTSDALHLVNATQTAHAALKKGFGSGGVQKFFIDQSNSIKVNTATAGQRIERNKMYLYTDDYDTRAVSGDTRTYHVGINGEDRAYGLANGVDTEAKTYTVQLENNEIRKEHLTTEYHTDIRDRTYYVKADEVKAPTPEPVAAPDTVVVKLDAEQPSPPVVQEQQTLIIDKPIIRQQTITPAPKPKIVVNPVLIDPPVPPKQQQQTIYVDKPVFKKFPPPSPPPEPRIIENPVYIDPPKPPKQKPQKIIVDKVIVKDFEEPPPPPEPIVEVNPVVIEPPPYKQQKPQRIVVDRPVIKAPPTPPPQPEPIIECRDVMVEAPDYPPQKPHRIVVEVPKFGPVKPAPPPPKPIIETKDVFVDMPEYPQQEPQKFIIEKPIIRDPGPPPPPPKPIVVEKPVEVPAPKWPRPEPQRIVIERPIVRPPGPPPPQPPPIIEYKNVYIDAPPWPIPEPQRIIVEKPIIRQRGPPPKPPAPIIIEKPVPVDVPAPPPPEPQRVIVEKPVIRQVVQRPVARRIVEEPVVTGYRRYQYPATTGAYTYDYRYTRPVNNVRSSQYVVQQSRGLPRYAWSEVGDREYQTDVGGYGRFTRGSRLYGQPRDFRRSENQFLNERGFARTINGEYRATRGATSYTFGEAYRMNDFRDNPRERRGSVSS